MAKAKGDKISITVLGDGTVGKSSLLLQFSEGRFSETYIQTVGIDFRTRRTTIDGRPVQATLWDTAGQEHYKSISENFVRRTHGVIVVYDTTAKGTFDGVQRWAAQLTSLLDDHVPMVIVGNKVDMEEAREVPTESGESLARSCGCDFFETSAKTGHQVPQAFDRMIELATRAMRQHRDTRSQSGKREYVDLGADGKKPAGGGGCC